MPLLTKAKFRARFMMQLINGSLNPSKNAVEPQRPSARKNWCSIYKPAANPASATLTQNNNVTQKISKVWTFPSDSNPNTEYETLQYADGSTSCNCKGWTRRLAADGSRSCKHTRLVDMGAADANCRASHQYEPRKEKLNNHAKTKIIKLPKLGHRKLGI